MGLYPFGKGMQFCGSHPAIVWPAESSAPASTAPSNSRGQKGRSPPGPEPMQPCWESTQGSLVVGWPRDWSGKEIAGGCGEVGGDRRCDRELCAPRAPSCPWHEAKHGRAPAGRPYPWPPPTCQKPEPEGQRGFMSRDVLKNFPRFPKNKPAESPGIETERFSTRALRSRTVRPKSPPYLGVVCPSVLAHSQLFLLFHRPHWFPDLCSSLNLPPCPAFQTPGSPSLSFPWRFSQNRLHCAGQNPMAHPHRTLCFLHYLTQRRCSRWAADFLSVASSGGYIQM